MSKYSMSLLPVLLSPSSSSSVRRAPGFLRASKRAAVDYARLLGRRLLLSHPLVLLRAEDDEDVRLIGFLCASHLSSESARLLLLRPGLLVLLAEEEAATTFFFLSLSHLSHEDARPGLLLSPSKERRPPDDEDGDVGLPPGLILCASHLSAASARLGLGGDELGRMMAHGGVGSSGGIIIMHLGGLGSSPGRAACAMARCTRATGIAMDQGRRGTASTARSSRGDEAERPGADEKVTAVEVELYRAAARRASRPKSDRTGIR
jgi:hypothetical protein